MIIVVIQSTLQVVLDGLNTGILGSNPAWDMDVRTSTFSYVLLFCIGKGLKFGLNSHPRIPTKCPKNFNMWKMKVLGNNLSTPTRGWISSKE
jgi:hypothetical protein